MGKYSASHLSNPEIRQRLLAKVAADWVNEADILVLLAEADLRKMYLDEGYPSMHAYCIGFFHFSRDVASQRIHAARAARDYPVLFTAVEEGRLHLSAVRLIAPHLTPDNVDELVAASTHRTCEEIEELIVRRFVRLETLREGSSPGERLSPSGSLPKEGSSPSSHDLASMVSQHAVRHIGPEAMDLGQVAPERGVVAAPRQPAPKPEPSVWVALSKRAHEKLQYAQALLSHTFADASLVMERALDDLIAKAEKQKFAATEKPRAPRDSTRPRCIPAHVRRAVWKRDGGQCTFVSGSGRRCAARKLLEYDHIDPVARGGKATVDRMRLRCRGHNQREAERAFGAGFMEKKREEARDQSISRRGDRPPPKARRQRDAGVASRRAIRRAPAPYIRRKHARRAPAARTEENLHGLDRLEMRQLTGHESGP
jgi:5-methylcytosine-specific restriction endonuclease McrA